MSNLFRKGTPRVSHSLIVPYRSLNPHPNPHHSPLHVKSSSPDLCLLHIATTTTAWNTSNAAGRTYAEQPDWPVWPIRGPDSNSFVAFGIVDIVVAIAIAAAIVKSPAFQDIVSSSTGLSVFVHDSRDLRVAPVAMGRPETS